MCALNPWILSDLPWCKWGWDFFANTPQWISELCLGSQIRYFTIHGIANRFPSPPAAQEPVGHAAIRVKVLGLSRNQHKSDWAGVPYHSSEQGSWCWGRWPNSLHLPFSHALVMPLENSDKVLGRRGEHGGPWALWSNPLQMPWRMTSLGYVLGSAFLYVWTEDS